MAAEEDTRTGAHREADDAGVMRVLADAIRTMKPESGG